MKIFLSGFLLIAFLSVGFASEPDNESSKSILIILRSSGEDGEITPETMELLGISQILNEAGYATAIGTFSGRKIRIENPRQTFKTIKLETVDVSAYDAFVIPSDSRKGLYHDNDRAEIETIRIVKEAVLLEKLIVAQRWGVVVLAEAGVLAGKQFAFPLNPEEDERFSDAMFVKPSEGDIVIDSNIITSSTCPYVNPGVDIARVLISALENKK